MINFDNIMLSKTTVGVNEAFKIEVSAKEVLPTWGDHQKYEWCNLNAMAWDEVRTAKAFPTWQNHKDSIWNKIKTMTWNTVKKIIGG